MEYSQVGNYVTLCNQLKTIETILQIITTHVLGIFAGVQITALADMMGVQRIARSVGLLQIFNGIAGIVAIPFSGKNEVDHRSKSFLLYNKCQ